MTPFAPLKGPPFAYWSTHGSDASPGWILWSPGPDGDYDINMENLARIYDPAADQIPSDALIAVSYDPTNGSGSDGDVWRVRLR